MTKKLTILFVHVVVALFLGYLSYMIMNKKQIPGFVGILLAITAMAVFIVHIYFYVTKNTTILNYDGKDSLHRNSELESKEKGLHGFLVDPNDPRSKPVGGFGGVGWI